MIRSLRAITLTVSCIISAGVNAASSVALPSNMSVLPESSPRIATSYLVENGWMPPTGAQEKRWSANSLFDFLQRPQSSDRTYYDVGVAIAEAISADGNLKAFRTYNGLVFAIGELPADPLIAMQHEDLAGLQGIAKDIQSIFGRINDKYEAEWQPYLFFVVSEGKYRSIRFDPSSEVPHIESYATNAIELSSREAWPPVTESTGIAILGLEFDGSAAGGKLRPLRKQLECLPAMASLNIRPNQPCRAN